MCIESVTSKSASILYRWYKLQEARVSHHNGRLLRLLACVKGSYYVHVHFHANKGNHQSAVLSAPSSVVCDAEECVEVGVGVLGVCLGCCVSAVFAVCGVSSRRRTHPRLLAVRRGVSLPTPALPAGSTTPCAPTPSSAGPSYRAPTTTAGGMRRRRHQSRGRTIGGPADTLLAAELHRGRSCALRAGILGAWEAAAGDGKRTLTPTEVDMVTGVEELAMATAGRSRVQWLEIGVCERDARLREGRTGVTAASGRMAMGRCRAAKSRFKISVGLGPPAMAARPPVESVPGILARFWGHSPRARRRTAPTRLLCSDARTAERCRFTSWSKKQHVIAHIHDTRLHIPLHIPPSTRRHGVDDAATPRRDSRKEGQARRAEAPARAQEAGLGEPPIAERQPVV
jgi:hypothetical protein